MALRPPTISIALGAATTQCFPRAVPPGTPAAATLYPAGAGEQTVPSRPRGQGCGSAGRSCPAIVPGSAEGSRTPHTLSGALEGLHEGLGEAGQTPAAYPASPLPGALLLSTHPLEVPLPRGWSSEPHVCPYWAPRLHAGSAHSQNSQRPCWRVGGWAWAPLFLLACRLCGLLGGVPRHLPRARAPSEGPRQGGSWNPAPCECEAVGPGGLWAGAWPPSPWGWLPGPVFGASWHRPSVPELHARKAWKACPAFYGRQSWSPRALPAQLVTGWLLAGQTLSGVWGGWGSSPSDGTWRPPPQVRGQDPRHRQAVAWAPHAACVCLGPHGDGHSHQPGTDPPASEC